jgi:hypothetical protein
MSDEFEAKGGTLEAIQPLGQRLSDFAFAQANEFIDFGQSPREAGSIVAGILLHVAWEIAGCGATADGFFPDKDKFRRRVEEVMERRSFAKPQTPSPETRTEGDRD